MNRLVCYPNGKLVVLLWLLFFACITVTTLGLMAFDLGMFVLGLLISILSGRICFAEMTAWVVDINRRAPSCYRE